MKITRRNFLKFFLSTVFLSGYNFPVYSDTKPKKNLIVIMLRGGMDGLCAVPVIGDKDFEKRRKALIFDETIKLNSDFALHPVLNSFHELWKEGTGTIVHATNIPYTQRSHFDGQNLMESGGTIPYQEKTGWLGRGMKLAKLEGTGLALSLPMPLLLRGVPRNDNYYPAKGKLPDKEIFEILKQAYAEKSEEELKILVDIVKGRKEINPNAYNFLSTEKYALAQKTGLRMRELNGPRIAVFEVDGFDTHAAQGGIHGAHSDCLEDINTIIKGLKNSLKKEYNNTLIVTLTEFGRTIKQNSGFGTEHGYGSAILMAGGLLKKSQVYTDWPGLKKKELFEGRDLNSTIDARSVYASAMSTVFDVDFKLIKDNVFWKENLENLSDKLFKT